MIICLGPFCVPIWPLFFLVAMPIWDRLPESWRENLSNFWDGKVYPTCVKPVLDRLPEKVKKVMLFGIRRGGKQKEKQEAKQEESKEDNEQSVKQHTKENHLRQRKEMKEAESIETTNGTKSQDTVSEVSKASSNYPRGKVVAVSSDEEFEEIVKAENLSQYRAVYLDFTATWCKPCQTIKPVFAELAEKHPDALFCTVDADDCEDAHTTYDVTSLPTIVKVDSRNEDSRNESSRLKLVTSEKLQLFVAA